MADLLPLKLETIEFTAPPTEQEVIDTLRKIEEFTGKLAGVLLASGKYPAMDQPQRIGKMLGIAATTRQTIEAFEGRGNIAMPQLQMGRPQ